MSNAGRWKQTTLNFKKSAASRGPAEGSIGRSSSGGAAAAAVAAVAGDSASHKRPREASDVGTSEPRKTKVEHKKDIMAPVMEGDESPTTHDVPISAGAEENKEHPHHHDEQPKTAAGRAALARASSRSRSPTAEAELPITKPPPAKRRTNDKAPTAKPGHLTAMPVAPVESHYVLFDTRDKNGPVPYATYRDKWNSSFVRLPCSPASKHAVGAGKKVVSRWETIQEALSATFRSSYDIEEAILTFNGHYASRWNFKALHQYFKDELKPERAKRILEHVIPKIAELALDLPNVCTAAIPLLRQHSAEVTAVSMSQHQIACLLANAFFCTFPRRNATKAGSEYSSFPTINFNRLFSGRGKSCHPIAKAKLQCIFSYFESVIASMPKGCLTFERHWNKKCPDWKTSKKPLAKVSMLDEGTIEDDGLYMLQVDFANKMIGGGVLGHGAVQEEIRFLICPELIVSRLFIECMASDESCVITGAQRYSKYTGYSMTFEWDGKFIDRTHRDKYGRMQTQIVAIDAIHYSSYGQQFQPQALDRELAKASSGFNSHQLKHQIPVATGNWGCGAFKGDARLKALLQLLACSDAGRPMVYFTFGDIELADDLSELCRDMCGKAVTVSELYNRLCKFAIVFRRKRGENGHTLLAYLRRHLIEGEPDTPCDSSVTDEEEAISDSELERLEAAGMFSDTDTETDKSLSPYSKRKRETEAEEAAAATTALDDASAFEDGADDATAAASAMLESDIWVDGS